jgi:DNA uptake protein ComE-like DNA-binding protein
VTVEEVTFTPAQAQAVLALVNSATEQHLDLVVGLDRRAAGNILEARPFESLEALAAVSYVGRSAMEKLREAVGEDEVTPE